MRHILRISVRRIPVEDDYKLKEPVLKDDAGVLRMETDRELHLSMSFGQDEFYHFMVDNDMKRSSSLLEFMFWGDIMIEFLMNNVENVRILNLLSIVKGYIAPTLQWVVDVRKKQVSRQKEIQTSQVNMKRWDRDLFPTNRKWFSLN